MTKKTTRPILTEYVGGPKDGEREWRHYDDHWLDGIPPTVVVPCLDLVRAIHDTTISLDHAPIPVGTYALTETRRYVWQGVEELK